MGLGTLAAPAIADTPPTVTQPVTAEDAALTAAATSGSPVLVAGSQSATAQTMANPDGTLTETQSSVPVRVQHNGTWTDVSLNLIPQGSGSSAVLVPSASPTTVSVGAGGSSLIDTVTDSDGDGVSESWPLGNLPLPTVNGPTATYAQVIPGVDLLVTATLTGVSQVLKIKTAQAAADPRIATLRLALASGSLQLSSDGGGGLIARAPGSSAPVLGTGRGQWWDSSGPGASAAGPGGPDITRAFELGLTTVSGTPVETVNIAGILAAASSTAPKAAAARKALSSAAGAPASTSASSAVAGVVYPLFVDPDWSTGQGSWDYVDSAYPTVPYWNGQYSNDGNAHVGYLPSAWAPDGLSRVTRSFWQFNIAALAGSTVEAAKLSTSEVWSSSCTATGVSAYVTNSISSSTTWNNQPGWETKLDDQSAAHGYNSSCPAATVGFDMGPTLATMSTWSQITVGLRADNESDDLGWKLFKGAATLTVTYDRTPNAPAVTSITDCMLNCTGKTSPVTYTRDQKPTFTATDSDPDGTAGGAIGVLFQVKNSAGTVLSQIHAYDDMITSGGTATWTVDTPLPNGTYTLITQGEDFNGGYVSRWSAETLFHFTVDYTQPKPPLVTVKSGTLSTDQTHPSGVIGTDPEVLTLSNAGSAPVTGYVYAVTGAGVQANFPGTVTCGKRTAYFVMVCPGTAQSVDITIAAVGDNTSLTVWAFDAAGNTSPADHSGTTPLSFYALPPAKSAMSLAPLSLHGGASWVDAPAAAGAPPATGAGCQGTGAGIDSTSIHVLKLSAPGDFATSAAPAADTNQSFSMGGWFCPSQAGSGTAISQQAHVGATQIAGALLHEATPAPGWDFSLEQASGAGYDTTAATGTAIVADSWYFASCVFDKINEQARLTVSQNGQTFSWVVAASSTDHPATGSTDPVVLGASSTTGADQFLGEIYQPLVTPGVLDNLQFMTLWETNSTLGDEGVLK